MLKGEGQGAILRRESDLNEGLPRFCFLEEEVEVYAWALAKELTGGGIVEKTANSKILKEAVAIIFRVTV